MNLKQFGEQLQILRKAAKWSQEELIEALEQLARSGPQEEYRVLDGTLLSRWERAHTQKGRQWKPTRTYTLHLIQLFAPHLDLARAQAWATQAGYAINAAELQAWFPAPTAAPNGATANAQPAPADQAENTPAIPHNLPTVLTSFVGREAEIARVLDYLAAPATRLITVVGEGGAGKTRLALEVAQRLINQPSVNQRNDLFRDGVYFVSLIGVSAASFVVSALANALGLALASADDPQQQLLAYVQKRHLLLVLDNFEHLVADASPVVSAVLQAAPGVQLLVTSRERLNLAEEWVLALHGLAFPSVTAASEQPGQVFTPTLAIGTTAEDDYAAVQLFVERARQTQAAFDQPAATTQSAAIVRICGLLQGIPLGIEMAAAWVHMLPCGEIADEIARNLDFLTSPHRNAPPRHRSMRAVFEHSWRLLTGPEQAVLATLAVFQGGFTREAAASVAKASLVTLRSLVDKSLLKVMEGRYELHELLRQFAQEKLQLDPTSEQAAQSLHAAYYGGLLKRDEELWDTEQRATLVVSVRTEMQNIRTGWRWAVTHLALTTLDQYIQSLLDFYATVSWIQEGREAFQVVITRLQGLMSRNAEANLLLAKALSRCALFEYHLSQYEVAARRCEQSLDLLQDQHNAAESTFAFILLGGIHRSLGRYREAQRCYQQSLALTANAGDLIQEADCCHSLGELAVAVGEYEEAGHWYQRSQALYRSQNSDHGVAKTIYGLGEVAQALGRFAEAEQCYQQSLLLFERTESRNFMARVSLQIGRLVQTTGDDEQTEEWYQRGYRLAQGVQAPLLLAQALYCFGDLACQRGRYGQAQEYLRSAFELALAHKREPLTLRIALCMATLLLEQSPQEQAGLNNNGLPHSSVMQAYQVLQLVANHPAVLFETRNQAQTKLTELTARLPTNVSEMLTSQMVAKLEERSLARQNLLTNAHESVKLQSDQATWTTVLGGVLGVSLSNEGKRV